MENAKQVKRLFLWVKRVEVDHLSFSLSPHERLFWDAGTDYPAGSISPEKLQIIPDSHHKLLF